MTAPVEPKARVFSCNPSFLSDRESISGFVVREKELALLMEVLRRNVVEGNRHVLLLGPRGSGKTSLLRCLSAAVRADSRLRELWIPVLFSEENYGVLSLEEFWLEALFHASKERSAASAADADSLRRAYEDLRKSGREDVGDMALARLLDYAASEGKRILLICENVGGMWGGDGFSDGARRLRETLTAENGIALMASATARFDKIDDASEAFFGFFRLMELKPLDTRECARLWGEVAGRKIPLSQARALEILTGGNPRLLTTLAALGRQFPFTQLTDNLEALVDAYTDYFKGRMEALPAKERKVFAALASMWRSASSGEVAMEARMDVRETSALLGRLVRRGIVSETEEGKRTGRRGKRYRLTERLFGIYCLLRRGDEKKFVREILHFMTRVYEHGLRGRGSRADRELWTEVPEVSPDPQEAWHRWVFSECLKRLGREEKREEGLELAALLLRHPAFCAEYVAPLARLMLSFAARSDALARRCLEILEEAPCGEFFIPLAAGLREYLGMPSEVPWEVREMAGDIRGWLKRAVEDFSARNTPDAP